MKLWINQEILQDGCRKRMKDTSLIKIKLHTPIYGKNNLNLLKEEGR